MRLICIDASVGVKWYNQKEQHSEYALKIRDSYARREIEIIVPDLFFYEIINALRYNPEFGQRDVKKAAHELLEMQLIVGKDYGFLESAADIAFSYGLTIYDSSYIALAQEKECELYTSDQKTLSKVDLGFVKHVKEFI
ncbi:MAG: type II toxin-antitoxin system VapC family toxin [Candidatus Altiarchaeota archaeon]|nr:type II toxin-antitoxin system VapC family toxin [Candidatus Altiarchaeota archaeon]